MNISAASATSQSSYQAALAASGQGATVNQVLASAYTGLTSTADGVDPLTQAAGQASLGNLVSAIYSNGLAQQGTATSSDASGATSGIQGLSASQIVGGIDSSAATALLTGLSSGSSSGLQGFDTAIAGPAALASATYQAQQAYGSGSLTSDAQSQASADQTGATTTGTTTGASSTTDTNAASNVAAVIQQATTAAQAASINNTFSLLA